MTEGQKIIKYLAIAFAVFLIISIFSGIFWTINSVSILLGLSKENSVNMENMQVIINYLIMRLMEMEQL